MKKKIQPSHYLLYLSQDGVTLWETPQGFISFHMKTKPECFIQSIFIRPELRARGVASQFIDRLKHHASQHGCEWIATGVRPNQVGVETVILSLLKYGFKVSGYSEIFGLVFKLEIEKCPS